MADNKKTPQVNKTAPVKKRPMKKKKTPIKVEVTLPPAIEQTIAQKIDGMNNNKPNDYIDVESIRKLVQDDELNKEKENIILYNAQGEMIDLSKEKEKSILGLGDIIKTVTTALGIESCEDCERRREKLNNQFSFLKQVKRELSDEEIVIVLEAERTKRIVDNLWFANLYNSVYGMKVQPCNCPSMYKDILMKLVIQIKKQDIK